MEPEGVECQFVLGEELVLLLPAGGLNVCFEPLATFNRKVEYIGLLKQY
jgi:hypothetical protein